ncbi:PREDICTED: sodium-coupled monocarboxylate transporter 1 [Thamnophis sirtalis]|uniref:Sodium-coupled monocarboxylate transporter 1 n=1 Tax=Thamnophis sirtalis TaxID=35019 RepID=A0A6I9Y1B2_9SAUR|nr:PREDICTED: sodium-coupled monocarboxylate transporter 1 [Thamnophis sirtalis]
MVTCREVGGFGVWDYVVFAFMLVISAVIGVYYAFAGGGQRTREAFLMGGRSMSAFPVALSLTASFMSAVTILGTPAEIYRFGCMFSLFAISYAFVALITAEIFMPVFYRLKITSTYEYLEMRFNRPLRLCGTGLFIILTILYTGIVIYAPALALYQVTGIHLWGAVVGTGVVCTFYCTLGGLKAVIWTDVFQAGIMIAGFLSVIIRGAIVQHGFGNIINDTSHGKRLDFWDFNPNPLQRHTFWTIVIGGTYTWLGIYAVNQSQVQRYLSCKSRFQAKLSLYLNLVGLWLILACAVLCGLVMYSVFKDCDPLKAKCVGASDQLMPYLVLELFNEFPGMIGLFVACAYSGTLSTVSSSVNALAAVTVEDLIKPYFTLTELKLSWISMCMSLFYGAVCVVMAVVASKLGALLQAALTIFGMIGGPLLGLFSLGILFPFVNALGAFIGLVSGFIITLWIGIGSHIYKPLPFRTLPLNRTIIGCNIANLSTDVYAMDSIDQLTIKNSERPILANSLYSLSYLYLSPVGTLITIGVGIVIALLTGGRKQKVDKKFLLSKEDLFCNFLFRKLKQEDKRVLDCPPYNEGTDNPAFNHIEMMSDSKT